jgi:site-specific recombinase XerD
MSTVSWTQGEGPLVPFAEGFWRELLAQGHPPGGAKHHLVLMSHLDRWLSGEGLGAGDLTPSVAEQFLAFCRSAGRRRVPTLAALGPLLGYLRDQHVLQPEQPAVPTCRDGLLARYRRYLVDDRGLTPSTVLRYQRFARRFLAWRGVCTDGRTGAEGLSSAEVSAYMLEVSSRLVVESAKREAADLRALLRFLYLDGFLSTDLGSAMPPVAVWRGTRLPRAMSAAEVDAVLDSCDRSTVSGRRDRAILVLLARLGLRSGEVAAVRLADVDWRAGELTVRGKARRTDRLPLLAEVGEALAAYLAGGRPRSQCPQLILTLYAPPRPIHPSSITSVVYRACQRAGLARAGGHQLRHALATEMLRRGGDLTEIAQVLRQSDLGTTSLYAKVDWAALRTVTRPWPGAAR